MQHNLQSPVRLGIEAENMGHPAIKPGIVATAMAAEEAGVNSISVSDHLLTFGADSETWLESMMSLAAISSVTSRAKLVTSVVILPQRNVLEFLRLIHTLDALSNGRFVLGVGSGWVQREFDALGYDFANRGKRMDEMLSVIRSVDAGAVPAFQGEHLQVPEGIRFAPHPAPGQSIPLYVGGSNASKIGMRRALQFGDGWMAYGTAGQTDLPLLASALQHLHSTRDSQGLHHLDTIYKLGVTGADDPRMITDAQALANLGFDEVIVQGIWDRGIEAGVEAIHRLQEELT